MKPGYKNIKRGKRADLGSIWWRSGWEANYARYLNWRMANGDIAGWEYEKVEFEFTKIKRGTRYYLPDFKITFPDGRIEYHEVKGRLTAKAATQLRRMAKFHPDVKVELIDKKRYYAIRRQVAKIIPYWE